MNNKILKVIKFLATGISEQICTPTLKDVERTIGITFEDWVKQPHWRPMIIEADKNSPPLSKAVVLAYAWAFAEVNKVSKELQYALEGIKYFVLKTDEAYQTRLQEAQKLHDKAEEELRKNAPPGFLSTLDE